MAVKDRRREIRISASDDELLAEAAALAGVSISEFILERALSDAAALVEEHRTIHLSDTAYASFVEILDAPLHPPENLAEPARRARPFRRIG